MRSQRPSGGALDEDNEIPWRQTCQLHLPSSRPWLAATDRSQVPEDKIKARKQGTYFLASGFLSPPAPRVKILLYLHLDCGVYIGNVPSTRTGYKGSAQDIKGLFELLFDSDLGIVGNHSFG